MGSRLRAAHHDGGPPGGAGCSGVVVGSVPAGRGPGPRLVLHPVHDLAGWSPGDRVEAVGPPPEQVRCPGEAGRTLGPDAAPAATGGVAGVADVADVADGALADQVAGQGLVRGEGETCVEVRVCAHARLPWARLTWMSPLPDWTERLVVASASPGSSVSSSSTRTSPVTVLRSR